MVYYTVRGHKQGKKVFESIGMLKSKAEELRKDIVSRKRTKGGSWAKNTKFTIKNIETPKSTY